MKRRVTGILLALLVANPFCCCLARGHSLTTSAPSPSGEKHACCAHEESGGAAARKHLPAPADDPEPCDCESEGRRQALLPGDDGASVAGGRISFEIPGWTAFGTASASLSCSPREIFAAHPSPAIHGPPARVTAEWFCVRRL
ncbi:MAG: hypothetical protein H7A52_06570 [Akkermansiaceae bacterium]|nr:hypothetical protein [Akkermansiaceae bacterium]